MIDLELKPCRICDLKNAMEERDNWVYSDTWWALNRRLRGSNNLGHSLDSIHRNRFVINLPKKLRGAR